MGEKTTKYPQKITKMAENDLFSQLSVFYFQKFEFLMVKLPLGKFQAGSTGK
jgi:hypothetical protein